MKTILIADDEPSLRLLVRATIDRETYHLLEAADGTEALEVIRRDRPDLVLLDVQMPGCSGLEVARVVRADPSLADVVLVMLTSRAQMEDVQAGLAAGAARYLTKPFSPLELVTVVETALRGR